MRQLFLHILPDSNQQPSENTAKTLSYHLSYTGFLQTKCRQQRHHVVKKHMRACDVRSVWASAFPCVMSDKLIRAHFKYCRIKTDVQTAHEHESHDLSMDFHSLCFWCGS